MTYFLLKNRNGFTLIEILITCFFLAILASIAIPKYQVLREQAMQESEEYLIKVIQTGKELYKTGMME